MVGRLLPVRHRNGMLLVTDSPKMPTVLKESTTSARELPREIASQPKAYAFERSLGIPPAEACRRAGGKVENGQATKWEQNRRVQAWIAYYRSLGHTDEIIAAKRARIEDRLNLAAYVDIFEFATVDEVTKKPVIDWVKVAASPYRAIIAGFKFDKDSGVLVDFDRDPALQAAAQLRDMHGFKSANKSEISGPGGGPIEMESITDADRVRALMALLARTEQPTEGGN
jgi:hypothetical protein